MSWQPIARKDFEDAVRSRTIWALVGVFVALALGGAVVLTLLGNRGSGLLGFLVLVRAPLDWVVPITALLAGYKAIAGERESGSLKLLLSLPHDRSDVVLGKLVGRVLVVATALLAGYGIAGLVAMVVLPDFPLNGYVTLVGLSPLLGAAFVGIAIGCSAVTGSTGRAAAGAVGVFVFFRFIWGVVPSGVYFVVEQGIVPPPGATPAWFLLLERVSPGGAFNAVLSATNSGGSTASQLGTTPPVYLTVWAAVATLALWTIVPPLLGYLRFRDADL